MTGYQTLIEAKNRAEMAMDLVDDVDVDAIVYAVGRMEHQVLSRRQFERFALRFDRAFHGLILSGYAAVGE